MALTFGPGDRRLGSGGMIGVALRMLREEFGISAGSLTSLRVMMNSRTLRLRPEVWKKLGDTFRVEKFLKHLEERFKQYAGFEGERALLDKAGVNAVAQVVKGLHEETLKRAVVRQERGYVEVPGLGNVPATFYGPQLGGKVYGTAYREPPRYARPGAGVTNRRGEGPGLRREGRAPGERVPAQRGVRESWLPAAARAPQGVYARDEAARAERRGGPPKSRAVLEAEERLAAQRKGVRGTPIVGGKDEKERIANRKEEKERRKRQEVMPVGKYKGMSFDEAFAGLDRRYAHLGLEFNLDRGYAYWGKGAGYIAELLNQEWFYREHRAAYDALEKYVEASPDVKHAVGEFHRREDVRSPADLDFWRRDHRPDKNRKFRPRGRDTEKGRGFSVSDTFGERGQEGRRKFWEQRRARQEQRFVDLGPVLGRQVSEREEEEIREVQKITEAGPLAQLREALTRKRRWTLDYDLEKGVWYRKELPPAARDEPPLLDPYKKRLSPEQKRLYKKVHGVEPVEDADVFRDIQAGYRRALEQTRAAQAVKLAVQAELETKLDERGAFTLPQEGEEGGGVFEGPRARGKVRQKGYDRRVRMYERGLEKAMRMDYAGWEKDAAYYSAMAQLEQIGGNYALAMEKATSLEELDAIAHQVEEGPGWFNVDLRQGLFKSQGGKEERVKGRGKVNPRAQEFGREVYEYRPREEWDPNALRAVYFRKRNSLVGAQ